MCSTHTVISSAWVQQLAAAAWTASLSVKLTGHGIWGQHPKPPILRSASVMPWWRGGWGVNSTCLPGSNPDAVYKPRGAASHDCKSSHQVTRTHQHISHPHHTYNMKSVCTVSNLFKLKLFCPFPEHYTGREYNYMRMNMIQKYWEFPSWDFHTL